MTFLTLMNILMIKWILIMHEKIVTETIIILIITIIIIETINFYLKKEILIKIQITIIDSITNIVKLVKEMDILPENIDIIHENQKEYIINIIKRT